MRFFRGHSRDLFLNLLLALYYIVKPAIPQPVRFAMRYCYARPLRWMQSGSWPIGNMPQRAPEDWPGWPNGKSFAFVLTHDVEGRKGLERCRAVAELEMRYGFRSAFYFVPEGEYETPASLRSFLTKRGFEVGVHDLRHDGTLYRSLDSFEKGSQRINHYLKEWKAVGFRAGFMRHNLQWLQKLDVQYDASTFDHDPFEPQPDGMHTVFPFQVRRDDGSSYVELPYSLPQDSTLFLVLREAGNELWKRKLDWVAAHGGMALVIVHPDYMALDGPAGSAEYPAGLYEDLLQYAKMRYSDQAWFALPREVAEHVRRHMPVVEHVRRHMPMAQSPAAPSGEVAAGVLERLA